MLLPPTCIDGSNAVVDTIHRQLVGSHAHDTPVLAMRREGDGVVAVLVPLPCDPEVAEDRDRPVRRRDVAERVQE